MRWSKRDLSAKCYVYFWVDGIHVQARLEEAAQCLLVITGATPEGKKELVGLVDGVRDLAVADGALGFWQRSRRCGRGRAASAVGCTKPSLATLSGQTAVFNPAVACGSVDECPPFFMSKSQPRK
jgi:hypothetical protein